MRINCRLGATLAFGALLIGSSALAQTKPTMSIRVGGPLAGSFTDIWVAQQHGIFAKNGLDVTVTQFNNGGDAINAMQGGAVDVAETIPSIAMNAIDRGFDMVTIQQDELAHAGPPDSSSVQVLDSSPIKTLADLRGKRMGVGVLNSQNVIGVKMLLDHAGVNPKDVQFSEVPFPAMAAALKAGQIDAVNPIDPFTTQLRSTGGRVISWAYVEAIPEMPVGAWFAKSSYLQANPAVVDAFLKSVREAIDWLNADETRARAEIAAFTKLDPALLKTMPVIRWSYHARASKWQAVVDMMAKYGGLRPREAKTFFAPTMNAYLEP